MSAFGKKGDAPRIRQVLLNLLPKDAEVEEKVLEPETEGEVFTHELVELKAKLTKPSEVKEFSSKVISGLDEYDREKITSGIGRYVDDGCNFYLRLSKSEAEAGNIVLESKDCIHIAFKVAAYPAKKENAVEAVRELFSDEKR